MGRRASVTDTLPSCMWQPHDIGRMLVSAMKLK